jgi:hypothetical protein
MNPIPHHCTRPRPIVLALGAMLCVLSMPGHAFSSYIAQNQNCSGCHGDPLVGSTPANGNVLSFGVNGKTLVGQSSNATFTVSDASTNERGGFKGSFPAGGGAFSVNGSLAIVGDQGFLRAQKSFGPLPANFVSESRVYSFAPLTRGTASLGVSFTPLSSQFTSAAAAQAAAVSVTFQGQGVAPVVALDTSLADTGAVRVGTSVTARLTVRNLGDGNLSGLGVQSNLNGSFAAGSGAFSGSATSFSLADGASQVHDYTFTPLAAGAASALVNVTTTNGDRNGGNLSDSLQAALAGTGVSPVFRASVGPDIDFGSVAGTGNAALTLFNDAPGADLGALTDLTLLSYEIVGADAGLFSLVGFSAGTLLSVGSSLALTVGFDGAGHHGPFAAMLNIATDEGSALGQLGNVHSFTLMAAAVPEPAQIWMFVSGLLGVGVFVRRRRSS